MNGLRRIRGVALWAAAGVGLSSCQAPRPVPPPEAHVILAPEQRAAMQSHVYSARMEVVFAATLAVLQDLEWNLDTVDRAAGLIRASSARKLDFIGPEDERGQDLAARQRMARLRVHAPQKWSRWKELVIHIEPWKDGTTRQRIVMNLRGTLPAMSYQEEQGGGWLSGKRQVLIHAPPEEQRVEVRVGEAYGDLFERIEKAVAEWSAP